MNNIYVHLIDMPYKVKGVHTVDQDGDYTIFLNSRICSEAQRSAYTHELKHIAREDLYAYGNVQAIETKTSAPTAMDTL